MKKNERLIIQCSCGKTVSSVRAINGIKPGTIVQSSICYACKNHIRLRKDSRDYVHEQSQLE